MKNIVILLTFIGFIQSCAPYKHLNEQFDWQGVKENRFKMSKLEFKTQSKDKYENGSLYISNKNLDLFSDTKALGVNDIVTIVVDEVSKAGKKVDSSISRKSSLKASTNSGWLGLKKLMNKGNDGDYSFSGSTELGWNGKGGILRTGYLQGTITAVIKEVLPNGNFVIEGKRIVTVNNEEQIMTLTGIIRPEDINGDNTIYSSKIANAKIEYSGRGILNDIQHPGWFMRILSWIWPL